LQRSANDLGGIDNPGLEEIFKFFGGSVETLSALLFLILSRPRNLLPRRFVQSIGQALKAF
jgi:hypothetical protein